MTVIEMAKNLKVMDEFICEEMDEETWETWITYGVPDGNGDTVEDYIWLVCFDGQPYEEEYQEYVKLFNSLVKGKDKEKFLLEYLPKTLENA